MIIFVNVTPRFKFIFIVQLSALRKKLFYERSRTGQHLSVVAFNNISFQSIIVASYLTEPVIIEWKQQKFLKRRFIIGKFRWSIWTRMPSHPSQEKFCDLWQIYRSTWKWEGIDCYKSMIYLEDSDFGNIFALTRRGVSKKGCGT